jgi:hypothetical protein
VATYGCESWTVRQDEEARINAFEMKGLRKILRVSWIAKKTNDGYWRQLGSKEHYWILSNQGNYRTTDT